MAYVTYSMVMEYALDPGSSWVVSLTLPFSGEFSKPVLSLSKPQFLQLLNKGESGIYLVGYCKDLNALMPVKYLIHSWHVGSTDKILPVSTSAQN